MTPLPLIDELIFAGNRMARVILAYSGEQQAVWIRQYIKNLGIFSQEPEVVITFADLLMKLKLRNFDLLVLDQDLAGAGGTPMIGAVRLRDPRMKILVVSNVYDYRIGHEFVRSGAQGYAAVAFPDVGDVLAAELRAVLKDNGSKNDRLERVRSWANAGQGPLSALSAGELEFLRYRALGYDLDIVRKILGIAANTAKTKASIIRRKLGVSTDLQFGGIYWIFHGIRYHSSTR